MKPQRIILIRHGESEGNINNHVYSEKPDYKLELTEKGREQARLAGTLLKEILGDQTAFFYVSPLWRTRTTFEEIVRAFPLHLFKHQEEPRIREQEWGHLKSADESQKIDKEREQYGTFYYRIPDGESAADVYDRVSDFFGTLHRDFEKPGFPENAIIVTHGMSIRLFLMRWFHWTVDEFECLSNPKNCQIVILEKNSIGKYQLITELGKKVPKNTQRPIKLLPHL